MGLLATREPTGEHLTFDPDSSGDAELSETWSQSRSAPRMRHWGWLVGAGIGGAAALVAAHAAQRQAPWIPWPYLLAIVLIGVIATLLFWWRAGPARLRISATGALAIAMVGLLPVPWMTASLDAPPGTAWRLDGNLMIDGEVFDPPGRWYWLTVGRPPLVAEVVRGWVTGASPAKSLRSGSAFRRPQFNEPAAAAVGLRAAGRAVPFELVVEVSEPVARGFADRVVVTHLNGRALTSRANWLEALDSLGPVNTLTTSDGSVQGFHGAGLPYRRVTLLDVPAGRLDAVVGGRLARTAPGQRFRNLAVGRSHGVMVALVTYAHASGLDLARGRTIAGTGAIDGDGSVLRIGGLRSKAAAAVRLGADVLLYPAEQAGELIGLDTRDTLLIPITSLEGAISALQR
jgi:hypothetical protein